MTLIFDHRLADNLDYSILKNYFDKNKFWLQTLYENRNVKFSLSNDQKCYLDSLHQKPIAFDCGIYICVSCWLLCFT